MRYAAKEHLPDPSFRCDQNCGPWPCAIARNDLGDLARSFPLTMRLYLSTMADLAAQAGITGDLTTRFTAWLAR